MTRPSKGLIWFYRIATWAEAVTFLSLAVLIVLDFVL